MLDLSAWTDQSESESERTWQLSKSLCQILLQVKIEPAHLLSVAGSIGDKSRLHSKPPVGGEQTAQTCAIAWFRQPGPQVLNRVE
jgi:hypothetical protein